MLAQKKMPDGQKEEISQVSIHCFLSEEDLSGICSSSHQLMQLDIFHLAKR